MKYINWVGESCMDWDGNLIGHKNWDPLSLKKVGVAESIGKVEGNDDMKMEMLQRFILFKRLKGECF